MGVFSLFRVPWLLLSTPRSKQGVFSLGRVQITPCFFQYISYCYLSAHPCPLAIVPGFPRGRFIFFRSNRPRTSFQLSPPSLTSCCMPTLFGFRVFALPLHSILLKGLLFSPLPYLYPPISYGILFPCSVNCSSFIWSPGQTKALFPAFLSVSSDALFATPSAFVMLIRNRNSAHFLLKVQTFPYSF